MIVDREVHLACRLRNCRVLLAHQVQRHGVGALLDLGAGIMIVSVGHRTRIRRRVSSSAGSRARAGFPSRAGSSGRGSSLAAALPPRARPAAGPCASSVAGRGLSRRPSQARRHRRCHGSRDGRSRRRCRRRHDHGRRRSPGTAGRNSGIRLRCWRDPRISYRISIMRLRRLERRPAGSHQDKQGRGSRRVAPHESI